MTSTWSAVAELHHLRRVVGLLAERVRGEFLERRVAVGDDGELLEGGLATHDLHGVEPRSFWCFRAGVSVLNRRRRRRRLDLQIAARFGSTKVSLLRGAF